MARALNRLALHTVCQQALCPNRAECFGRGTATFLLLGPVCTRDCAFCAVKRGRAVPADPSEPLRLAEAVADLGICFCVLTMVTRDDLKGGGAQQVAAAIRAVRRRCPGVGVEVLISDLGGNDSALERVLEVRPEVLNHNLETVSRLYAAVRPQADYRRSLDLLAKAAAHDPRPVIKSGLMLGLGENFGEVLYTMDDLRRAGCDLLTLGQYLAPSPGHHPVVRYVPPEEFAELEAEALARGFSGVAAGPYVRSSFKAEKLYRLAASNPAFRSALRAPSTD